LDNSAIQGTFQASAGELLALSSLGGYASTLIDATVLANARVMSIPTMPAAALRTVLSRGSSKGAMASSLSGSFASTNLSAKSGSTSSEVALASLAHAITLFFQMAETTISIAAKLLRSEDPVPKQIAVGTKSSGINMPNFQGLGGDGTGVVHCFVKVLEVNTPFLRGSTSTDRLHRLVRPLISHGILALAALIGDSMCVEIMLFGQKDRRQGNDPHHQQQQQEGNSKNLIHSGRGVLSQGVGGVSPFHSTRSMMPAVTTSAMGGVGGDGVLSAKLLVGLLARLLDPGLPSPVIIMTAGATLSLSLSALGLQKQAYRLHRLVAQHQFDLKNGQHVNEQQLKALKHEWHKRQNEAHFLLHEIVNAGILEKLLALLSIDLTSSRKQKVETDTNTQHTHMHTYTLFSLSLSLSLSISISFFLILSMCLFDLVYLSVLCMCFSYLCIHAH